MCPDHLFPCLVGGECREPSCNRYGSHCWCHRDKQRREGGEITEEMDEIEKSNAEGDKIFVTGDPEDWEIDCQDNKDCPPDWSCLEQSCFAPLSFPSAAWASLSAPVVSGVG